MGGLNDEIDRLKAENDAFREGGQWRTYIEALS